MSTSPLNLNYLMCPLDGQPILQSGNSLRCSAGHSFDIARQGYVNLLPVQKKRSLDPGDSREMVAARQRFLAAGHYRGVAEAVATAVLAMLPAEGSACCLDAGCGEGYYLRHLQQAAAGTREQPLDLIAVDISKWAVQAAVKSTLHATCLVASNARLPVISGAVDCVLCMFGFPVLDEFSRLLTDDGVLILVEAGPRHLVELREIIYTAAKPLNATDTRILDGFELFTTSVISDEIMLNRPSEIHDLLTMTPHMYRANSAGKSRALALPCIKLSVDVRLSYWRKRAAGS